MKVINLENFNMYVFTVLSSYYFINNMTIFD
jgi:hypothetical protein